MERDVQEAMSEGKVSTQTMEGRWTISEIYWGFAKGGPDDVNREEMTDEASKESRT